MSTLWEITLFSEKFNPVSVWFSPLLAKDYHHKIESVERSPNPTRGSSFAFFRTEIDTKSPELVSSGLGGSELGF
jgi:hypothetical protein